MNTQLVLHEVSGPLTDFFKKLEGSQGEAWLRAFKKFLRKENPWEKYPEFTVWKTIQIGNYANVAEIRQALKRGGFKVESWADGILSKVTLSESKATLNLVCLTVEELGFPESAQLTDIYVAAEAKGLELCPAEVGPQLRLHKDQSESEGEWYIIAMQPIADSGNDPWLFSVSQDGTGPWLSTYDGFTYTRWFSNHRFVFVLPK